MESPVRIIDGNGVAVVAGECSMELFGHLGSEGFGGVVARDDDSVVDHEGLGAVPVSLLEFIAHGAMVLLRNTRRRTT